MGWLVGWDTRRDLVLHLSKGQNSEHWSVEKHCCVGNNMWVVAKITKPTGIERHICLFLMQKFEGGEWGYKDIDESMGLYQVSCPVSYLEDLSPPNNDNSREWRERVRAHHAMKQRKLTPGMRLGREGQYLIVEDLGRKGYHVIKDGTHWRLQKSRAANLEIFTGE